MIFKPIEFHSRSIAKSVSYRLLSIMVDSTFAYLVLRDPLTTAGVVLFVNGYSTLLYYFHERIWAHVHWGHRVIHQAPK